MLPDHDYAVCKVIVGVYLHFQGCLGPCLMRFSQAQCCCCKSARLLTQGKSIHPLREPNSIELKPPHILFRFLPCSHPHTSTSTERGAFQTVSTNHISQRLQRLASLAIFRQSGNQFRLLVPIFEASPYCTVHAPSLTVPTSHSTVKAAACLIDEPVDLQ